MSEVKRYVNAGLGYTTESNHGDYVKYENYTELKAQRDALAAENAEHASSLKALATLNNRLYQWTSRMSYNASYVGEPEGMVKGHIRKMEKILDASKATPATDAYLNSVRAEGVDMVLALYESERHLVSEVELPQYDFALSHLKLMATKLRAGEPS